MKITISVNDKEVLSFDVLVTLAICVLFLLYKSMKFFFNLENNFDPLKSVISDSGEFKQSEMKFSEKNINSEIMEEKEKKQSEIATNIEKNEGVMKVLETKLDRQIAIAKKEALQKKEEEWMVIRKGKKVKSAKKN